MAALSRCRLFLGTVLIGCVAISQPRADSAEFLPAILTDDPRPEPPFADEVEVRVQPVFQTHVPGEDLMATVAVTNLTTSNVRLPHGWGNHYLCEMWIEIDGDFAARHGIQLCDSKCYSICAPVARLRPSETAYTTFNLGCYLQFTKPVRAPIPVAWRLLLREGQEKRGYFMLRVHEPSDPFDEIMERHRQDQDKDLRGLIESAELPDGTDGVTTSHPP